MPLVIPQKLTSVEIATPASPSPWSIDPERTQQLTEATSPDATAWSATYHSAVIAGSSSPSPWTIDPERTQEMEPSGEGDLEVTWNGAMGGSDSGNGGTMFLYYGNQ